MATQDDVRPIVLSLPATIGDPAAYARIAGALDILATRGRQLCARSRALDGPVPGPDPCLVGRIEHKSVHEPDEVRELPAITLNLVSMSAFNALGTIAVFDVAPAAATMTSRARAAAIVLTDD